MRLCALAGIQGKGLTLLLTEKRGGNQRVVRSMAALSARTLGRKYTLFVLAVRMRTIPAIPRSLVVCASYTHLLLFTLVSFYYYKTQAGAFTASTTNWFFKERSAQAETHIFSNLSLIFQSALNLSITVIRSIPSEQNFKEFSTTFNRILVFQELFKRPVNLKLNTTAFERLSQKELKNPKIKRRVKREKKKI